MHQPCTDATVGVRQSATALIAPCMRRIVAWNSARGRADDAVGQHTRQRPAHRGYVEAVAEMLPRAGEHDRAHVAVGVQLREHLGHLGPERRSHRIALAGTDQRHLRDMAVQVDRDGFV